MIYLENIKRHTSSLIALATILVIAAAMYNQAVFGHYHVLDNGVVVYHSHYYNADGDSSMPFETHTHSNVELTAFNSFHHKFDVPPSLQTGTHEFARLQQKMPPLAERIFYASRRVLSHGLRAPPTFA